MSKIYTTTYLDMEQKRAKNHGAQNGIDYSVAVGSGPKNSHHFADIAIRKVGNQFLLMVDGVTVKEISFTDDNLHTIDSIVKYVFDDKDAEIKAQHDRLVAMDALLEKS